jgi:hypothetical protein
MKNSNHLKNETSPYLLQHAYNPVNWYPWGDEALSLARENDLPILLSIGYSACHWCHVMERESFENDSVADFMNQHFVNIKVDREERPDLDHIYMDALQAMTGSGGWPLNVFLTSACKPFYGGTYFPPVKAYGRMSWTEVLQAVAGLWSNKRDEVEGQAEKLLAHIKGANSFANAKNILPETGSLSLFNGQDCSLIASNILKTADTTFGGFGKAPKFLQTFSLQYLLQYSHAFGDESAKAHAVLSLKKMLNGGIYDQVAGGISRYSTDDQWLAPHFEKMLYDNALFTSVLCDAFQSTKETEFELGIRATLGFSMNEMKHPLGGYYAALDADSEGVEGKYYVWQMDELTGLLGGHASLFCEFFGVSEGGNWEGVNILNVPFPAEKLAEKYEMSVADFKSTVEACCEILAKARAKRTRPGTDDKILLGSNALLLTAFCRAYAALGEESYKLAAIELYEFLDAQFRDPASNGGMKHTFKENNSKYPAFLDDYAYLIQSCIHLQEITSNQQYLNRARELAIYVLNNFFDASSSFLFYTHKDQKDVIVRKIECYDGATPSANAVMASNLVYLGIVFDQSLWKEKALSMLHQVLNGVKNHPSSFGVWAVMYLQQTLGIHEIVVTGGKINAILRELLNQYIPNKILQSSTEVKDMPLLKDKSFPEENLIYLCRNYSCEQPMEKINTLMNRLKNSKN